MFFEIIKSSTDLLKHDLVIVHEQHQNTNEKTMHYLFMCIITYYHTLYLTSDKIQSNNNCQVNFFLTTCPKKIIPYRLLHNIRRVCEIMNIIKKLCIKNFYFYFFIFLYFISFITSLIKTYITFFFHIYISMIKIVKPDRYYLKTQFSLTVKFSLRLLSLQCYKRVQLYIN